ncbi:type II secretion system F family protein [Polynucleobacter sp. AP-Reno-20A-A9]|uniref:type II secretion system F family protein n=1 Tax=Polynucleobacter sp. AP-Reno-20A-A9 TaxID=2576925 RepID=UPI001C0CE326|nr:type II secretion system F family protein [Polynucleobacter sp. AP-Reno-20A-A9]MBU3628869.1 type II secretion system F family protein [Polynucleobacter sp. AP-Reno-20A-A9]
MNFQFIFTLIAFTAFFIGLSYAIFSFLRVRFSRIRKRVDRRLEAISSDNQRATSKLSVVILFSSYPRFDAWLKQHSIAVQVYEAIQKLRWNIRVDQFLFLIAMIFVVTNFVFLELGASGFLSLLFSLIAAICPLIYLKFKLAKRQVKLETQLPEILDFIARAMQAGHTFVGSLQMAANESREPIASEFQKTFQEISFGRSVQESMSDLSARIDCPEMRYFAVAVFINQEIGGNLASLINGVAKLIRERLQTKMTLHAMTSEARSSAWILSIMPFAVALLMAIVRPDFIGVLWSEQLGRSMVGYTLVLMFIGIFWMQRMAKIRV